MRYTKWAFCAMVFMVCTAQACPARCKKQSDCATGEICTPAVLENGESGTWCIEQGRTQEERQQDAKGWHVKSVTIGAQPSVTLERGE